MVAAGLLCGLAVIGGMSCNPAPTGPGPINIYNQNTNNNGQPGPGSSPSPGQGGELPAGSWVRVGMFGQSCPSGVTVPQNGTRQIKPGCTALITATPKAADGSDLPASIHGQLIAWSVPAGAGVVNVTADSEPFNRSVRCLGLGTFTLSATVKGVTGTADFECIGGGASAMDGNPPPPYPPPPRHGLPFPKPGGGR